MPKVKIYSTSTCPWCAKTKEFFKSHKIPFTNIDVSSNQIAAKEMMKKSGQMGVPVIDINGKIIVGFNEDALKNALKMKSGKSSAGKKSGKSMLK
jgi:glutaredoxin-like YruB-family protein